MWLHDCLVFHAADEARRARRKRVTRIAQGAAGVLCNQGAVTLLQHVHSDPVTAVGAAWSCTTLGVGLAVSGIEIVCAAAQVGSPTQAATWAVGRAVSAVARAAVAVGKASWPHIRAACMLIGRAGFAVWQAADVYIIQPFFILARGLSLSVLHACCAGWGQLWQAGTWACGWWRLHVYAPCAHSAQALKQQAVGAAKVAYGAASAGAGWAWARLVNAADAAARAARRAVICAWHTAVLPALQAVRNALREAARVVLKMGQAVARVLLPPLIASSRWTYKYLVIPTAQLLSSVVATLGWPSLAAFSCAQFAAAGLAQGRVVPFGMAALAVSLVTLITAGKRLASIPKCTHAGATLELAGCRAYLWLDLGVVELARRVVIWLWPYFLSAAQMAGSLCSKALTFLHMVAKAAVHTSWRALCQGARALWRAAGAPVFRSARTLVLNVWNRPEAGFLVSAAAIAVLVWAARTNALVAGAAAMGAAWGAAWGILSAAVTKVSGQVAGIVQAMLTNLKLAPGWLVVQ